MKHPNVLDPIKCSNDCSTKVISFLIYLPVTYIALLKCLGAVKNFAIYFLLFFNFIHAKNMVTVTINRTKTPTTPPDTPPATTLCLYWESPGKSSGKSNFVTPEEYIEVLGDNLVVTGREVVASDELGRDEFISSSVVMTVGAEEIVVNCLVVGSGEGFARIPIKYSNDSLSQTLYS